MKNPGEEMRAKKEDMGENERNKKGEVQVRREMRSDRKRRGKERG